MNYYFEFGGGLGDILFRIFAGSEYRFLERLPTDDNVRITLSTINPFADELFEWHPKRRQLDIRLYRHWWPNEDELKRQQYGLPPKSAISLVPQSDENVEFYPSMLDKEVIESFTDEVYFVMAAAAGGEWRVFPDDIVSMVCREATNLGVKIIAIGRNYPEQRGGARHEPTIPHTEWTVDLIDQLSVSGTAKLIEGAAGVICSHSSMCLLSWWLKKPVLLLYPDEVYKEHIVKPRTGYTLGLDFLTTKHALFRNCTPLLVREFFAMAMSSKHNERRPIQAREDLTCDENVSCSNLSQRPMMGFTTHEANSQKWYKSPKQNHYYLEFGGGLGDVFQQLYDRGRYNVLRDLRPGDTADVVIVSHNPFVTELFKWHPKRSQISVYDLGYWSPSEDMQNREKFNLPPPGVNNDLPAKDDNVEFYCSQSDNQLISELLAEKKPIILLAFGAGTPDRNIPEKIASEITQILLSVRKQFTFVRVGRTYERNGRCEPLIQSEDAGADIVWNTIDKLSVPGTAELLQASAGLVTAHSALSLLGWRFRKTMLLLYPQSTYEKHLLTKDCWGFGVDFPETVHARFEEFTTTLALRFLEKVNNGFVQSLT